MARIGGKGMTSNRYVVLNCPTLMGNRLCYSKVIRQCADCTDCVMKQVIQECRKSIKCFESNEIACPVCSDAASAELAQDILQLFDIEEINK